MKSRQFQHFSRAKQKRSRFGVDFARLFEKSGSLEPHKANNHRVLSALFYVRVLKKGQSVGIIFLTKPSENKRVRRESKIVKSRKFN